jgi:hypothetical protein
MHQNLLRRFGDARFAETPPEPNGLELRHRWVS